MAVNNDTTSKELAADSENRTGGDAYERDLPAAIKKNTGTGNTAKLTAEERSSYDEALRNERSSGRDVPASPGDTFPSARLCKAASEIDRMLLRVQEFKGP